MRRALPIAGGVALGLVAILATAAGTRPGSSLALSWNLNGQPIRWTLPDGGQSGLFGSGQQCADLTGANASVVMFIPEQPVNVCFQPSAAGAAWDGGCNSIDTDVSFGVPLQPWVPQYAVLDPRATAICGVSDAGSFHMPIFKMY